MKVTETYNINGMACKMCAGAVEKALSQTSGVESVEVNLADKNATVTFDDATTNAKELQAAVKGAGYDMIL